MGFVTLSDGRIILAGGSGFIKKGDFETSRKQYNELTEKILVSKEKERFYEGKIKIEKDSRQRLEALRRRV